MKKIILLIVSIYYFSSCYRWDIRDEFTFFRAEVNGILTDENHKVIKNTKIVIVKKPSFDNCYKCFKWEDSLYTDNMGSFSFKIRRLGERYNFIKACENPTGYISLDTVHFLVYNDNLIDTTKKLIKFHIAGYNQGADSSKGVWPISGVELKISRSK